MLRSHQFQSYLSINPKQDSCQQFSCVHKIKAVTLHVEVRSFKVTHTAPMGGGGAHLRNFDWNMPKKHNWVRGQIWVKLSNLPPQAFQNLTEMCPLLHCEFDWNGAPQTFEHLPQMCPLITPNVSQKRNYMVSQHSLYLICTLLLRIHLFCNYVLFGGHIWPKFYGKKKHFKGLVTVFHIVFKRCTLQFDWWMLFWDEHLALTLCVTC